MAKIEVTLKVAVRPWAKVAMEVLAYACAAASIVSMHLANRISDIGARAITRWGLTFSID